MPVVHELARAQQRRRHRVHPGGLSAVGGERRPRGFLLVLRQADRPPAGQVLGGLPEHVRADAEGVADDQADGARDGRVRPEAGAERAARGVEAELVPDRAVDHDQRSGAAGGLPAAAERRGVLLGVHQQAHGGALQAGRAPGAGALRWAAVVVAVFVAPVGSRIAYGMFSGPS
jgi:hypothetical protein